MVCLLVPRLEDSPCTSRLDFCREGNGIIFSQPGRTCDGGGWSDDAALPARSWMPPAPHPGGALSAKLSSVMG